MEDFDLVVLVAGGLLLVLDVFAEVIRRLWLSVPLVALAAGVLLGPELLGVIEPARLGEPKKILEGMARLALALTVVDIGLRFDTATLARVMRPGLRLLAGGMVGMWLVSGLGTWLLLDLDFWRAMLVGAILAPTDPVVAAVLTSEAMARSHLPLRLRRLLQFESGANDGLAIVIFLLPVFALTEGDGAAWSWLGSAAREVAIALGGGVALGLAAAAAVDFAARHKDVQRPLLVGVTVGVSLATLGGVHLLEGSGIIAAFAGALVFAVRVDDEVRRRLEGLQQAVANLMVPPVFAFFGMLLPFGAWQGLGLGGLVFAVWALALRRPPVVAAVLARSDLGGRERAFVAWFGPIGVAAMYYATAVGSYVALPDGETIFAAASLVIAASVVAHGISATPLVHAYAGKSPLRTLLHPLAPAPDEQEDVRAAADAS